MNFEIIKFFLHSVSIKVYAMKMEGEYSEQISLGVSLSLTILKIQSKS